MQSRITFDTQLKISLYVLSSELAQVHVVTMDASHVAHYITSSFQRERELMRSLTLSKLKA